jgi:hypothetical protein
MSHHREEPVNLRQLQAKSKRDELSGGHINMIIYNSRSERHMLQAKAKGRFKNVHLAQDQSVQDGLDDGALATDNGFVSASPSVRSMTAKEMYSDLGILVIDAGLAFLEPDTPLEDALAAGLKSAASRSGCSRFRLAGLLKSPLVTLDRVGRFVFGSDSYSYSSSSLSPSKISIIHGSLERSIMRWTWSICRRVSEYPV